MPENPVYNPDKIISKKEVGSEIQTPTPVYNPKNIVKKDVIDTRTFTTDSNVAIPEYKSSKEFEVDSAIDFLKQKGGRNGSTVMDSEWDVLKDVLKDSRATQEQRKNAILTIQGYDPKHTDDNTMYYNKREENGVYMPTALAYGEKPPQGYHTASIWGNQNKANNDPWYLDLGKSLANGVVGAAQSVVDVSQIGTALVTGEESKYLNKLSNTAEALKFEKDKDLNAPIFNTEGITQFSDLVDKDRFDFSPKALWGSLNMAAESIVPFIGATKGATTIAKGSKGFIQGLKGVGKEFIDEAGNIQNAIKLGDNAVKATIFTGSFATQVGDVYDESREAGLKPRDAAGLSTAIGAVMAGFDVKYGIDAKIMSQFFQNEKRAIFKNTISSIERDAVTGEITKEAFKKLVKETSISYGELAKNGIKEVVKDAVEEGGQEAAQDFTQKAGEHLWDKMSDDEKAKFGTDAFSAKSFGSYLNSLSTGFVSGAPMSVGVQILKNKHDEQSINAYDRVKQGPEAVSALKADLATSVKNGDITPEEHDQAIFKIDSYGKYHEETKGVNLQPVDEKKAFELSFQIQGLKTEIPTNENEISKLDPIPRSKVESKQKQVKELQSELNDIIRNGEIKGEPVVPKKEEERIIKEREKESKLKESHKTAKENRWEELIDNSVSEKELDAVLGQMDNSNQTTPDLIDYVGLKRAEFIKDKEKANSKLKQKDASSPNENFPIEPKVEKKPDRAYITDKRTYKEVPAEEFNHSKTDDRLIHRLARKEIWEQPNHEVNGQLYLHQYEYNGEKNRTIRVKLEDGKILKLGSSKIIKGSGLSGYLHTERLKGNATNEPVGVKVVELAPEEVDGKIVRKRVIKIYQKSSGKYLAYVKETHTGAKNTEDKRGKALYSQEQIKGELEDIKSQHENPLPPEEVEALRNTPIVPIIPKTIKEKAADATEKIVEEGKEKVKTSKKAENGKQESAVNGEKPTTGSAEEANGEDGKPHKESVKKGGVKAILRKPKEVNRVNAGKIAPDSPYHDVMKYFIDGGRVSKEAIRKLYKDSIGEVQAKNNITYSENKYDKKYAPNLDELAHTLWENAPKELGDVTTEEYKDALELVLQKYDSPIEMAKDYIKALGEKERVAPSEAEQVIIEAYDKLNEELGYKLDIGIDYFEGKTDEELKAIAEKDKWEEGTDIITNESSEGKFYTEDEIKKIEIDVSGKLDLFIKENFKSEKEGLDFIDNKDNSKKDLYKEYYNIYNKVDLVKAHNENLLYDTVDKILSKNNFSIYAKKQILNYFRLEKNNKNVSLFGATSNIINSFDEKLNETSNLTNLISEILGYENNLSDNEINSSEFKNKSEKIAIYIKKEIVEKIKDAYSRDDFEPFQKVSQRKGDYSKVAEVIQKAFNKDNIKVIVDESKFKGVQSTVAGKLSADGKNIYLNPNYAGLDTPIHEAGHVLIDAMGYDNKIIQAAIKQLRTTPLYAETKERYPELSEQELDKEVLAEAIGREGADIFDNVNDKSKFKQYLDYIFDWFKRKLGIEKNIAKSLAKQIISGVGTKGLKGAETGKEQLSKESKKKNPIGPRPLNFQQYAAEEGFNAQKEFDKYQEASVEYKEAESAEQDALVNGTLEEHEKATLDLKEAKKSFAIKAKKYFEYKKYQKDFRAVQEILKDKDLDSYTYEELNDLITKLFSFNDKAAKSVKERAYQKLGHKVTVKQQEVSKGKEGVIESLAKTSDISPLQGKILHHSHFSEKNADVQAVSLAYGKAIIDKLSEANSLKDTHEKLGLKVIQEENKILGITGKAVNRFSSDSSKYFEWMVNEDGNYLTADEAKAKGLSKAKLDYLDFHRETVAGHRESMSANDYENVKMGVIRVDKNFREAYKSEGLIPAFSYYLGGGATNLGRVRIIHNGKVMSYSEIEKEIIAGADKKSIQSMAKALFNLLVANIKARYQLKKGQNVDEKDNPLELKGDAEYSLNEKGQLVSKFDKPRSKDRGYSKDFYKAMNQFIDESAHVKHISKIMPLVEAVEYLNKNGYTEEGYIPKKNVSKWINDWKALHIFKEPHVNDPVIDAAVKGLRKLVASTTMWFNIPANTINVFMGNYNNWRAENAETLAKGNSRLFGGKGSRKQTGVVNDYALAIIKKYNLVNQDFDSHPVIKANGIFAKLATFGTQVGEYQIQGSLGLGLLNQDEFDSFEFTKDKYGNDVLTVKKGVDEDALKAKITQIKNRVTDIQGKYPDEDRRNIMRGEFGKALFQFKVWMPDWFKERFSARYINAYGVEKEGSYTKMLRVGVKEMSADLKKGDIKKAITNPAFVTNLKGMATIGALLALKHAGDDDDEKKKGGLSWDSALSQVLFIFDLEQDKYMVSNPAAVLGKLKDFINAFGALVGFEEDAWQKTKRIIPANKAITFAENLIE